MQDEVLKHTEKIYKAMKNSENSFKEKLKEILVEVFIIVFAVTLSIWLHSWSEHRQEQKEVKEFLSDLKVDLKTDIESMQRNQNLVTKDIKKFEFLKGLDEHKIDSIKKNNLKIHLELHPTLTEASNGNYEGFKSSGKIGQIENKKLKSRILGYYQEMIPIVEKIQNYYNVKLDKLGDISVKSSDSKELYLNPLMKGTLDFVIQYGHNNIEGYKQGINKAQEIIAEINKENKE